MSVKKIVYHTYELCSSGGMERVLIQKANWLARHGYSVEIITTERESGDPFFPLDGAVRVVPFRIGYNDSYRVRNVFRNILLGISKRRRHRRMLADYLEKNPCDVLITLQHRNFIPRMKDGSRKIFEVHFSRASKLYYTRFHSGIHGLVYRAASWWQDRGIARYDRFVVLTEQDYADRGRPRNGAVIPNSITIAPPERKAPLTALRAICVGRLSYQKGIDYLAQAWRIVHRKYPEWRLDIFGRTYGREESYAAEIERLGLSDAVRIHEPTRQIEREYLSSSLYIMSSRYEGFPLVLGEAMACGVPCVSFGCPCGPRDIIKDGEDGLIVPEVGDVEGLASAICSLIENPSVRGRMGECARRNILRFGEDRVMQKWVDLFDGL